MDAQESFSYFAPYLWGIWGVWNVPKAHVIENELPHGRGAVGKWGNANIYIHIRGGPIYLDS